MATAELRLLGPASLVTAGRQDLIRQSLDKAGIGVQRLGALQPHDQFAGLVTVEHVDFI